MNAKICSGCKFETYYENEPPCDDCENGSNFTETQTTELERLQATFERVQAERDELREKYADASAELLRRADQRLQLRNERAQLRADLDAAEAARFALEVKVNELENELEKTRLDVHALEGGAGADGWIDLYKKEREKSQALLGFLEHIRDAMREAGLC